MIIIKGKRAVRTLNNPGYRQKLLEFFETVAELKSIELDLAPRRMLEDLNGFCSVINDWVNEEVDCVSA